MLALLLLELRHLRNSSLATLECTASFIIIFKLQNRYDSKYQLTQNVYKLEIEVISKILNKKDS